MADKKEKQRDPEPKVKMYQLKVVEDIEADSIEAARNAAPVRLRFVAEDKKKIETSITRVVRAKYSSRADRLDEAKSLIDEARGIIEELKDEIQQWHDNLPENFQNGDKGQALEECQSNLEQVESSLDDAESNCDSVEFPGMFD
jgi:hypothetical protein